MGGRILKSIGIGLCISILAIGCAELAQELTGSEAAGTAAFWTFALITGGVMIRAVWKGEIL